VIRLRRTGVGDWRKHPEGQKQILIDECFEYRYAIIRLIADLQHALCYLLRKGELHLLRLSKGLSPPRTLRIKVRLLTQTYRPLTCPFS